MHLLTSPVVDPGLYRLAANTYHADPCPTPSLTQSVAAILLDQSPRHAWYAHPRLNPQITRDESRRLDIGTVAHALLVGEGRQLVEIDAPDYRTKVAQAQRDTAYAQGQTPVLTGDLLTIKAMVTAARIQLSGIKGAERFFTSAHGTAEVVAVWREGDQWCRALIDWIAEDRSVFVDYKTVSGSAHPDALGRRVFDQGYEIQAAFYERGLTTIEPDLAGRIEPVFVFQEIDPPYLLTVAKLDAEGPDVGRAKVEQAIETWDRCMSENSWPGYPLEIATIRSPTYQLTSWADREARDHLLRADGYDPFLLLQPWSPVKGRVD